MSINSNDISKFKDYLKEGYCIAYPTETIYGLGIDPFNKEAFDYLRKIKNRTENKPFILLVKDIEMLKQYAELTKEEILNTVWPGPISVILKAKNTLPNYLLSSSGTISFRVSSSKFLEEIFKQIDFPIISTSANPEGFVAVNSPTEIHSYFQRYDKFVVYPDIYNDITSDSPSTIADFTKDPIKIIRKGAYKIAF